MILLVCTEGEQTEECDDTASPNDESPYETVIQTSTGNIHQVMIHVQPLLIATVLNCMRSAFLH